MLTDNWRKKWQSTPGLLPGKSHGQRNLVGYSPWGHKESDMTERLHSLTQSWDDSFHNCLIASPYSVNVIPSLIIDYINYLSYFPTKITTVRAKLLQLCPTLCDLMNHSLPGSSVHRILQAWILEWIAVPSSRGSSQPRDWICYISCIGRWVLYHSSHHGFNKTMVQECKFRQWRKERSLMW